MITRSLTIKSNTNRFEQPAFVLDLYTDLPLHAESTKLEFVAQRLFIHVLQQSGAAQLSMHLDCSSDDDPT
jgi:hypothetical protein